MEKRVLTQLSTFFSSNLYHLKLSMVKLWRWHVNTPPENNGPLQRRTRVLSMILFTFILLATVTTIVELLTNVSLLEILMTAIPAFFYIFAYRLNQTGRNSFAAGLTIGTVFLVVLAIAILEQNSYWLEYVLIALFLTSLFLTTRLSITVFVLTMIVMHIIPRLFPGSHVSNYADSLYLVGVIGILIVITTAISRQDIKQIEEQSLQLEDENYELQQMEEELRESRDKLEIRVVERTAELDLLNHQLSKELDEKAKVEQKLKGSEERYRTLVEAAMEEIFIIDRTNRIEFLNGFAANRFGRSVEEIIGQPLSLLFPPEIAEHQNRNIQKVYETGEPVWVESEIPFPGGLKWLSTGLFPLKNQEGKINAILGFSRDIGERKQMEVNLRKSEERFRNIYENAVEGIFQSSLDGHYLHVNNAMARIFGYESPEEMIALVGHDIEYKIHVAPANRDRYLNLLKKDGVISGFEALNYRKDGSQIWTNTHARLVTDANGNGLYTEGFLIDITSRKQAEFSVKASEIRFKSLFEYAPISLWEEDFSLIVSYLDELRLSGISNFRAYFESHPEEIAKCAAMVKIVDINEATLKLYQAQSKGDFLENITSVFCEESFLMFIEELIALAENKDSYDGETVNQTLKGEKINIALSSKLAPGLDNTSHRLFVSITDITKFKQAELAILQSNENLAISANEMELRNTELALLSEMGDFFQSCQTSEEAYKVIEKYASRIFQEESGCLSIFDDSRNALDVMATWGNPQDMQQSFQPIDCWALRRGRIHLADGTDSGLVCPHLIHPTSIPSVCIPLVAQSNTLGILTLEKSDPKEAESGKFGLELTPFSEGKLSLAKAFAEHIGLALANLKLQEALRHKAIRDPLTNLYNRRFMEESLERELKRAERKGAPLGILMLDIDYFKKFNDTFGHEAGDSVLRELGIFFKSHIREEDIACRYGGEEFLLIFPDSSLNNTRKRAEELLDGVRKLDIMSKDRKLGIITLSGGLTSFPAHGKTIEALLKMADQALYRAKAEGRDRLIEAS